MKTEEWLKIISKEIAEVSGIAASIKAELAELAEIPDDNLNQKTKKYRSIDSDWEISKNES